MLCLCVLVIVEYSRVEDEISKLPVLVMATHFVQVSHFLDEGGRACVSDSVCARPRVAECVCGRVCECECMLEGALACWKDVNFGDQP